MPVATDLTATKKLIDAVDLSSTIYRLIKVNHWKIEWALKASQQYRNYLFLKIKYGKMYSLPPSLDIDEVWHAHVLHTEEYYEFCQHTFGFFLHHNPHHGKDGSLTDADIARAFENETQKLYHLEFGSHIDAVRPLPIRVIMKRLLEFTMEKVSRFLKLSRKKSEIEVSL